MGTSRPDQPLRQFIAKFDLQNQRLIRAVRKAVRERFAGAHEPVYDNYNFFVIGYSPTERPSDAIVSITANANGVGLCFIRGASLADPHRLLGGSGHQTRFIRLESATALGRPDVEALIAAAIAAVSRPARKGTRQAGDSVDIGETTTAQGRTETHRRRMT